VERLRSRNSGAIPVLPAAERRGFFIPAPRGLAWLAPGLILAVACSDPGLRPHGPFDVSDDAGRTLAVGAPATRVVSLLPSVTELIISLGGADRLVARTGWDTDPRIAHLPTFGRTLAPSAERILTLQPDLVIGGLDSDMGGYTAASLPGLRVYLADVEVTADIISTTRRLGVLLGMEERADSLAQSIADEVDALRAALAGRDRPTVLYLLWPDPPQTAGVGTYIDEIIEAAGGRNAFADLRARWPEISLEAIVRRDPDLLVLPSHHAANALSSMRRAPGWRELGAIRSGRVLFVDANLFDRPGPRVAVAARTLAAALHPDVRLP
jgi:iron complex transport system substrate-binding protein